MSDICIFKASFIGCKYLLSVISCSFLDIFNSSSEKMKMIIHILVMFAVVINIQGHRKPKEENSDMHSKPIDLLQRLKLLNFQNIEIIRKYVSKKT